MISWLTRIVALSGYTVVALMAAYYVLIHHNGLIGDPETADLSLLETMLVYVAGCLLLFIACLPNVIWKWDKHVAWQKVYLAGVVISFPGLGLGIMLLVASMPK